MLMPAATTAAAIIAITMIPNVRDKRKMEKKKLVVLDIKAVKFTTAVKANREGGGYSDVKDDYEDEKTNCSFCISTGIFLSD